MVCRRTFLSTLGAGLAGTYAASQRASAASTTVSGTLESAVAGPIDGSTVEFFSPDVNDFTKATVEDGRFEAAVEADVTYYLTFYQQDRSGSYRTSFDDVPLLYGLDDTIHTDETATDLGAYELPEGYLTQIRFEDLNGNPIRHLDVVFRASTGSGTGPGRFTTNSDGYVYITDETDPGIELSGEVGVELQEPGSGGGGSRVDHLRVTEDSEFTIPIRDPEAYGGVVMDASADGTATSTGHVESADAASREASTESDGSATVDSRRESSTPAEDAADSEAYRGFLTNDSDSSLAFLNDPVTLTWAGIGVSIVGIVAQLLGRQS
ncbi:hypothetical protein D3D02_02660 [Halobellus sp. Atlit-38R]|uniref:hypothetical protein n=1 Tax=Halobellus sp. Atlit-38R TaxID=2282131 RepID=UPI000EF1EDE5|nr:hypothetical protein [Halobellus sp. Atlit-38R]RLM90693.1 hypothetical protein D3D02_02660 [Halobellus sp. Atlit-38R]